MSVKSTKAITLFIVLICFLGCSTNLPLTKKIEEQPTTAESILIIPQRNLNVTVQSSNAGNTGLLGALILIGIDSARQEAATKQAAPIIARLEEFDFRMVMREALTTELSRVTSVNFSGENALETVSSNSQEEISYKKAVSDAVLFVNVSYTMQNYNLKVTALCRLYPKAERLNAFKASKSAASPTDDRSYIYKNTFSFVREGITPDNVIDALKEGAENISKQIVADLNNTK
ncbi:MAG: hypothetical protein JXB88_26790 [Spirochaetales bacterium]|nr:hypothetical protein [Spirochaetales bacterium]